MRVVACLLVVTTCTTTTKVIVKGDEVYRKLDELRATGKADLETQTVIDEARTGKPGVETVRYDTPITHEDRTRAIVDLSKGCTTVDAEGNTIVQHDGCYFGVYGNDQFVLHEDSRFNGDTTIKYTLALAGFATYGAMSYCFWNCENDKLATASLIGIGLVSVGAVILGIVKASD